jgi:PAS domain S-box-containing protein
MIHSGFPMYIAWGPDLIQLYNDVFGTILGPLKHPALGRGARETFAEAWDSIGPLFETVMHRGSAHTVSDRLLPLNRSGALEECYFTLSCSPIPGGNGAVGGVFLTLFETTDKVAAERSLHALRERQREADTWLSIALRSAGLGVWHSELGTGEVTVDPTLSAMFGLLPEQTILRDEQWQTLIHPDDRARALSELAARRSDRNPLEIEFRIVRRDGTVRWMAVQGSVVSHGAGGARSVGVARDITESKHAAERQQLLLHELNHRVRNSLATVLALAQQSASGAASREHFLAAFQARVMALAEAHNLLTGTNWETVLLRELVEIALAPERQAHGSEIDISGPLCRLQPQQALAMTLGLHELVTNARKYGALSVPTGGVSVHWQQRPAQGGDRLAFSWIERGGPPVSQPSRAGFGMRLLTRALARDLDGTVQLDFEHGGVRCTIDFPVARGAP